MARPAVLETIYAGRRFRSRLEARWAVLFDRLGLAWEYEPEGYLLPRLDGTSLAYLPDFYIEAWHAWVEIKPAMPEPQMQHIVEAFGAYVGTLIVFAGVPRVTGHGAYFLQEDAQAWPQAVILQCRTCETVNWLVDDEHGGACIGPCIAASPHCHESWKYPALTTHVEAAYFAASSARFEHGETPYSLR